MKVMNCQHRLTWETGHWQWNTPRFYSPAVSLSLTLLAPPPSHRSLSCNISVDTSFHQKRKTWRRQQTTQNACINRTNRSYQLFFLCRLPNAKNTEILEEGGGGVKTRLPPFWTLLRTPERLWSPYKYRFRNMCELVWPYTVRQSAGWKWINSIKHAIRVQLCGVLF